MSASNPVTVTYYLNKPETRPNPYHLGSNLIFRDGQLTLTIQSDKVPSVDARMARYNATREVPAWAGGEDNGVSENEEDRDVTNGTADPDGEVPANGGSSDQTPDTEPSDDQTDEGSSGSETDEGNSEGSETEQSSVAPEPAKRLKPEEKEAGLTYEQAGAFRASDFDDPKEWLAAQGNEDDEDLV